MKKRILFFSALALSLFTYAQVGIATETPDTNSDLTLGSTNKGLRLNKVALTGTKDAVTVGAHTAGMVVYNTATAGTGATAVEPAFYYNDGTKWNKLKPAQDIDAVYDINAVPPPTGTSGITQYTAEDGSTSATLPSNADTAMFIDINGVAYTWDGTKFVTFNQVASTEWYLKSSTTDAGSNKTNNISRPGYVNIGDSNAQNKGYALSTTSRTSVNKTTSSAIALRSSAIHNGTGATSVYGIFSDASNSSTDTTLGTLIGFQSNTTNSTATTITNFRGATNLITNGAAAGAFTNGYGLYQNFTNSSNSTDPINTLQGIVNIIANNGFNPVSTQYGINISNTTGNTSSTGVVQNMRGLTLNNSNRTQQSGDTGTIWGFDVTNSNQSATNPQSMMGMNMAQSVTGSGYARSYIRGVSNTINSSSTGTGVTPNVYTNFNSLVHSSSTNEITNVYGLYNTITNSGKIAGSYVGSYNVFMNNSTLGNTIPNIYGDYTYAYTSDSNTDNVTTLYGLYNRIRCRSTT